MDMARHPKLSRECLFEKISVHSLYRLVERLRKNYNKMNKVSLEFVVKNILTTHRFVISKGNL